MTLELRDSTDPSFNMFMEGQRRNEEARRKRARILAATTKQKRSTAVGYIDPEKTQRIDNRRREMSVNQTSGTARQNGVPRHHVATAADGTQTSVEGPRPQEQRVAPSPGPTPPNRMMGLDPRIMGAPPPVFRPHSENYEELITDPEQRFARSRSVPSDKPGPVAPQEYMPEPTPLQGYVGRTRAERFEDRMTQDESMELADRPLEAFEFSRGHTNSAGEPNEEDFRAIQRIVQRQIDIENGIDPEAVRYPEYSPPPEFPPSRIPYSYYPKPADPIEELVQEAEEPRGIFDPRPNGFDPFGKDIPLNIFMRHAGDLTKKLSPLETNNHVNADHKFIDRFPVLSGKSVGFNPFMDGLNPRYPEPEPALLRAKEFERTLKEDREAMADMELEELLEFIRQREEEEI